MFANKICIEEEQLLLEKIDSHGWTKLLNRRVQHYGYEFVYGANNVDKHKKIGDLPDFCSFMKPSKFKYPYIIIILLTSNFCYHRVPENIARLYLESK